ncbi:MAG TPA: hypothetical protein PLP33_24840 [Leptospiraceae bacterium]|nr:hypothetical protein [Leptospiraceae bacterium]
MEKDEDLVIFEVEFSNSNVSYALPWYYKIPVIGQFIRYFMEKQDVC